jgi:phosphoglycolate phosphatase
MSSGVKAAIFDLDGTIADSAPDIAAALNAALVEAGHLPFDLAAATAMVGAGARTLVARALAARGVAPDAETIDKVHARFVAHYHAHSCVETRLYPGARETLEALAASGWQLGICTNKPDALARLVLGALGLTPLFGSIVGGRDGVPLKPARDMVAIVLSELGVEPGRAVMIGDSKADLGAGHAAGLPVVLLSHGYSDGPVSAMGADAVADGFEGLAAVLVDMVQG